MESLAHLVQHETKRRMLVRFLLVLGVVAVYFLFIVQQYGVAQGALVTALTWSFFVLCTPIADAGILLDVPVRILTHARMVTVEILVWIIAIALNATTYALARDAYSRTGLLQFFEHILTQPFPYWGIIVVSSIGTFLSIRFGDELLDSVTHAQRTVHHTHKRKHRMLIVLGLFLLTVLLYDFLLRELGIHLSDLM